MSVKKENKQPTEKDIENYKNLEVFNPSNFVFYTYFDGVKREFKYKKEIRNELRTTINQYKLYEIKVKSCVASGNVNGLEFDKLLNEKKDKYKILLSKIEKWKNEKKLELSDYKIIEPKVAVDLAILVNVDGEIKIPLIDRKYTPKGIAFPGGFIEDGDTVFGTVLKESFEEINFYGDKIDKKQFSAPIFYDGIDKKRNFLCKDGIRDPRSEFNHTREIQGKVSTHFFSVKLDKEQSLDTINKLKAGDDAAKVKLYNFNEIVKLLKNKEFAQGHGELLIRTLMTVPEFVTRYNQRKYMFDNDEVLKNMIDGYNKSIKTNIIYDVQDKCVVPNL